MSKDSTPPFKLPAHGESCCSVEQSTSWLNCVCEMALDGDSLALSALPIAAQHWLDSLRQDGRIDKPAAVPWWTR